MIPGELCTLDNLLAGWKYKNAAELEGLYDCVFVLFADFCINDWVKRELCFSKTIQIPYEKRL